MTDAMAALRERGRNHWCPDTEGNRASPTKDGRHTLGGFPEFCHTCAMQYNSQYEYEPLEKDMTIPKEEAK